MIDNIQQSIQEAIEYKDQPLALEVLTYIQKNNITDIPKDTLSELGYVRLPSLSTLRASTLFKDSILDAYKIPDFVLSDELDKYVQEIELVPDMIEFVTRLEQIFSESKEILGREVYEKSGKTFMPEIGHWLADYTQSTTDKRDVFSQSKYLNTSKYPQLLTKEERLILQDIIKCYDYLDNILVYWHLLDQMSPEEVAKYINFDTDWVKLLPGVTDEDIKRIETAAKTGSIKQTSAVAVTKPVLSKVAPPSAPAVMPTETAAPFKIPLQNDLDFSPTPKRGLVFDQKTNIDLDDTADHTREQELEKKRQLDIQAKLLELKKRQQGDE